MLSFLSNVVFHCKTLQQQDFKMFPLALQAIKAGWVDSPETVKYKLGQALDLDLNRLLLDPLHAMMVVARTISDNHALKGEKEKRTWSWF
jgi:hypothetical protein